MALQGQVLGRGAFAKTKMCKFNLVGKCTKGSACPWAHDEAELKATPDLQRTKLCKDLLLKGVCQNPKCTFAHSKQELRSVKSIASETKTAGKPSPPGNVHKELKKVGQILQPVHASSKLTAAAPEFVPAVALTRRENVKQPMLSSKARDFVPGDAIADFLPVRPPPGLEDFGCPAFVPVNGKLAFAFPSDEALPEIGNEESDTTCGGSDEESFSPSWASASTDSASWLNPVALKEGDSSKGCSTKIDGSTPISEILAMMGK